MANENPSRENPSRQQSAERSQTGSSQQGTGAQQGSAYGGQEQGSQGQAGRAQSGASQGRHEERGQRSGTGRADVGASTWQDGRQSDRPLSTRGGSSLSPLYESSGYGGGPFSVMRRISDEMDRLFENFGFGRGFSQGEPGQGGAWDVGNYQGAPSMWSPHIEVSERDGKLLIQADLPGMKRDDINVRVEDDEVIIQGERRQEQTSNQRGYYRSERSYGSFYRTIPLPEGTSADSANATFKDGVLEIRLDAPRPTQRGRTLQIQEGSPHSGSHSGTGSGTTYGAGTTGTQHGSSGTIYSGSGDPSVGAAGMGSESGSGKSSSDR
ncbi:MAG TPA: Hsp20/alpha crystallin family protein [Casimicrobiaceae bacterium]|nr:Hsp20/alpha crystallin family protein [Casimicrobiaceae bacterium]